MNSTPKAPVDPDVDALWRTIYGEAEGQDAPDALAIGWVILNRRMLPNWPDSIAAVTGQPWQFSCWNTGNPRRPHLLDVKPDHSAWTRHCYRLAEQLLAGTAAADPTSRSTHYYATYAPTPAWARARLVKGRLIAAKVPVYETPAGRYNHLFFNDIDTPPPRTAREALDQIRPLSRSSEIRGAIVGAAGAVGSAATAVAENAGEIRTALLGQSDNLETLGFDPAWIAYGAAALGVLGFAWVIGARIRRRREGVG